LQELWKTAAGWKGENAREPRAANPLWERKNRRDRVPYQKRRRKEGTPQSKTGRKMGGHQRAFGNKRKKKRMSEGTNRKKKYRPEHFVQRVLQVTTQGRPKDSPKSSSRKCGVPEKEQMPAKPRKKQGSTWSPSLSPVQREAGETSKKDRER